MKSSNGKARLGCLSANSTSSSRAWIEPGEMESGNSSSNFNSRSSRATTTAAATAGATAVGSSTREWTATTAFGPQAK